MASKVVWHSAEIVKYEPAHRRLPIELAIQSNRNGRNFNQERGAEGVFGWVEQQLNIDSFQQSLVTKRQSTLWMNGDNLTNSLLYRRNTLIGSRDLGFASHTIDFQIWTRVIAASVRTCTVPHERICTFSNEFHTLPLSPYFCLSSPLCTLAAKYVREWCSLHGRCSLVDWLKQSPAPLFETPTVHVQ